MYLGGNEARGRCISSFANDGGYFALCATLTVLREIDEKLSKRYKQLLGKNLWRIQVREEKKETEKETHENGLCLREISFWGVTSEKSRIDVGKFLMLSRLWEWGVIKHFPRQNLGQ